MSCTRTEGREVVSYYCAALCNDALEAGQGSGESFVNIGRLSGTAEPCDLRIGEQIVHQYFHADSAVAQVAEKFQSLAVELVAVTPGEQFAIDADAAQGFLQIVACGVGELLQILIGAS